MTLKERWAKLNQTEKLMIICVILLVIMIATRLSYTIGRVQDGFLYLQSDSTERAK